MNTQKFLRIRFQDLQILHQNPTVQAYYSVTLNERLYFTSVFDDELTLQIKNDMILPMVQGSSPEAISLQRWQNHIIVFDHDISLTELKTKPIIKKKIQARKSQILTLTIQICENSDLIFRDTILNKAIQHYLILQNIRIKQQSSSTNRSPLFVGACFFKITTSKNQFDIPVQNGNCLIHLPQTFEISQYKNDKLFSRSKMLTFDEINNSFNEITLFNDSGNNAGKVVFNSKFVIDDFTPLQINYLLLHSVEVLISQFQLKFDLPNEFIGSKVKILCNNKAFELNDELGNSKMIKIKKAVWIICKNLQDIIQIRIERSDLVLSKINIFAEQLHFCQLLKFKQKIISLNDPKKTLGLIKFNIQKTKGATSPQYNQFWKECMKKKSTGSLLIEQVSICYDNDEETSMTIKTENEQKTINQLSNINFFEEQPMIYHPPISINPKTQETIYFMLKNKNIGVSSEDFIGIAVINMNDIKIGKHPYEMDFYKNQEKLGSVNCLITKYLPLTFVKSSFQPEVLPLMKMADLKLSLNTLTLSPYFFSYKYDRKNQVFCIVEVNRIKKVLILQPTFQELSFVPSSTSDNLSFNVDVQEVLRVKITMMIGDGMHQEIYGTTSINFKMQELREKQQITQKGLKFNNFIETVVGTCNLVIHLNQEIIKRIEKSKSKQKLPFQNGRMRSSNSRKLKEQEKMKSISVLESVNASEKQIQIVKNLLPAKRHIRRENPSFSSQSSKKGTAQKTQQKSPVKLPLIREKKPSKQSFTDLLMSMNMRKRTKAGYDYNRTQDEDNTARVYFNSSKIANGKGPQKAIDYQSLRNSNPNIDKNLQMLFPTKKGQTREQAIKSQLNKYEQKLRGLKSVLNQISNDIDPIQPSVKQISHTDSVKNDQANNNFQYAGNQFL